MYSSSGVNFSWYGRPTYFIFSLGWNFLAIFSLFFVNLKMIIKEELWSIMHKGAMPFVGLRHLLICMTMCFASSWVQKQGSQKTANVLWFYFLAALKKHNKSICILKSTESNHGSLTSAEFHLVERVEGSPAITYSDTFIIWNYFCTRQNYSRTITFSMRIVYTEDW